MRSRESVAAEGHRRAPRPETRARPAATRSTARACRRAAGASAENRRRDERHGPPPGNARRGGPSRRRKFAIWTHGGRGSASGAARSARCTCYNTRMGGRRWISGCRLMAFPRPRRVPRAKSSTCSVGCNIHQWYGCTAPAPRCRRCTCLWNTARVWGRIGATTHTSPVRVLGEQLGGATFSHVCASELLAVAVATL